MKKLFTLIAAALMTIGASAKTPLTATWSSWGDGCTVDGNTITFTAAWKGAGYWVSADASTSDKLVIVLAEEAVGKTKIFFQCQPETGTDLVSSGDYFITAGSKILGIDLQSDAAKDRLSAFQQICAQSTEANCKIVVKEIYLGTNEEYENDLAGNKQQTSPLSLDNLGSGWGESTYDASTKTVTIGEDWSGKGWWLGTVDYSDFDQLVIKFDPATATNGNIVIEYNAGESTKYEFAAGTTTAIIDLDATGKASVKQIYIQGPAASKYVLSAAYVATKEYVAENETTGGEEPAAGVTYQFNNQAATYVLGDNAEATTYTMDSKVGFSVNYTSTTSEKMQIKLAANPEIFFEYSNSSAKNNAVKTGENYMQCDSKNFVINIPVKAGDVIYVKYSAKGSNAAKLDVYGSEPAITADADAVKECTGKTEGESVIFKATATKGGTAKIKETNGGMRIYAISINQKPTGIQNVKVADAKSANGAIYNLAGQKVKKAQKGIFIQDGKKVIVK
jgi:hypothetical protein